MLADPYPVYQQLRAPAGLWVPPLDAWVVTGYEAVSAGLRNPQFSSDRFGRIRQRFAGTRAWTAWSRTAAVHARLDPPEHTRLRGLVNKAFTPRAVDALEGRIQEHHRRAARRGADARRMDLIRDWPTRCR